RWAQDEGGKAGRYLCEWHQAARRGSARPGLMRTGPEEFTAQGLEPAAIALLLSQAGIGREVVDRTGLTARYDFKLRFAPTENMRPVINGQMQPVSDDESGLPSVFTAVQEQLGLKLGPSKGEVEGLEIEHVERPTEN